MYAEQVAAVCGTRYAPFERDGVLTLQVRKRDHAATLRGMALLMSAASLVVAMVVSPISGPTAAMDIGAAFSVVLLYLSSQRFARDRLAPDHSYFRRVRRSVQISYSRERDGYRENAFGRIAIDDEDFDIRELRSVPVFVVLTDAMGRYGLQRDTEFVPAMLFEGVAYELDRFSEKEAAQSLANAVLSACSGQEAAAATVACPPWNPERETRARSLARTGEICLWTAGVVVASTPVSRGVALAMMVVALIIDVVMTMASGRRMGGMRTALIGEYLDTNAPDAKRRAEAAALARARAHAAPAAKRTEKKGKRGRKGSR
jgi:hypothetical protein